MIVFFVNFKTASGNNINSADYGIKNADMFFYLDVKSLVAFVNKNGIKTEDLVYLLDTQTDDRKRALLSNLLPEIISISVSGNFQNVEKGEGALVFISGSRKFITFLNSTGRPVKSSITGAVIYQNPDDAFMYTLSGDIAVFGQKKEIENYLKLKNDTKPFSPAFHKIITESKKNKDLYVYLPFSNSIRLKFESAVKKGRNFGRSVDHNVFLRAIMDMNSMEAYTLFQDRPVINVALNGKNSVDGHRLIMFSHFLIVGSSLALPFLDYLSSSFGEKPIKAEDESLVRAQEIFGRIASTINKNSIVISFQMTDLEKGLLAENIRGRIRSVMGNVLAEKKKEKALKMFDAIKNNDLETIKNIINDIRDVNVTNREKDTLLCYAARIGHSHIISYLISNGADINSRSGYDTLTPLLIAVKQDKRTITRMLLQSGANKNMADDEGKTALHYGVELKNADIVNILLDFRVDINAVSKKRVTPLHIAADKGYMPIVKALVDAGAKINAVDDNGHSPLDRARMGNHKDVLDFLESRINKKK